MYFKRFITLGDAITVSIYVVALCEVVRWGALIWYVNKSVPPTTPPPPAAKVQQLEAPPPVQFVPPPALEEWQVPEPVYVMAPLRKII